MTFDLIKTNVYSDGASEFPHSSRNHADDLRDFHVPMHRLHNATAHGRGIAAGLEVSGAPGAREVVIEAGVAVDGSGRAIVLAHPSASGMGDISPKSSGDLAPVPVPVHLPLGAMAGGTVFLTIQFSEILDPKDGSGGRRVQIPWLRLQPTAGAGAYVDDGGSVILAIAAIDAEGRLKSLVERDGAVGLGRATLGLAASEVRLRRSLSAANRLQETHAGKLRAGARGGLELAVPNADDSVTVLREDGGALKKFEVRAAALHVHGSEILLDGVSNTGNCALADANGQLVINPGSSYAQGVRFESLVTGPDGVSMMGNPAQKVVAIDLIAWLGEVTTFDIDLGVPRSFTTFVATTMVESLEGGNAAAIEVYQVDGITTSPILHGEQWGAQWGEDSNLHTGRVTHFGRFIRFRVRTFGSCFYGALGLVFYE